MEMYHHLCKAISGGKEINGVFLDSSKANMLPFVFVIFMNDLTNVIECCNIRMFMDDTCLFLTVDNREEAAETLNHDVTQIQSWADQWLITFSPPKIESLIIPSKKNRNNIPIKEIQFQRYLGI